MNAYKYLDSRLGRTIEDIKVGYLSGKRIFFIQTSDMDIVHDIVTSGAIVPYQREVRSLDKKTVEVGTNVHYDNFATLPDDLSKMSVLSQQPNMPHAFIWAGGYDKENKQEIPWKKLFACVGHYSQLSGINIEDSNLIERKKLFANSIVMVIIDVAVSIPLVLEPYSVMVRVPAISRTEFDDIIIKQITEIDGANSSLDKEVLEQVFNSMRGMTHRQIVSTLNACKIRFGKLSLFHDDPENNRQLMKFVRGASEQILDSVTALTLIQPSGVEPAGMHLLSNWIEENAPYICSINKCQERMQNIPNGILVSGIPGSGKSMMAKYIAHKLGLGLIRFDMGDVNGKFVGDSEKNMNQALSVIESLSPIVVWVDEIEKGLSGASDGHEVTKRLFGKFLTWMQEKSERGLSCFVFATANDISKMPPEMFRSGRFDEKFFMFLPSAKECGDIFESHIRRQCKDYAKMNKGNSESLPLFNTKRINKTTFIRLLESDLCITRKLGVNDEDFIRCNKFFTGADIAQLITKAKSRYFFYKENNSREYLTAKDAIFDSELFESCIKEVASEMRTFGETNLDDVAINYAKLVKCNFVPASDQVLVPFSGYNHNAIYQTEVTKLYVLEDEDSYVQQLKSVSEYDKQLYLAVRNAINGVAEKIKENNK